MKLIVSYALILFLMGCLFENESDGQSYTSIEVGNYVPSTEDISILIKIKEFNEIEIQNNLLCFSECRGIYKLSSDTLSFSNRECRYEIGFECAVDKAVILSDWITDSTVHYPLKIHSQNRFDINYYHDSWVSFVLNTSS